MPAVLAPENTAFLVAIVLKVLPDLVRESAKPLEAIESIKIVQVDGLTGGGGNGGAPKAIGAAGGSGNLASDALAAALTYRAQAPIIDGLMKDLGLDGKSLDGLVNGAADKPADAPAPKVQLPVSQEKPAKPSTKAEKPTAAETNGPDA